MGSIQRVDRSKPWRARYWGPDGRQHSMRDGRHEGDPADRPGEAEHLPADHDPHQQATRLLSRFYDEATDPKMLRQITDEIMFELRELSSQDYVHEYAKRKAPDEVMEPEATPILSCPPLEAVS